MHERKGFQETRHARLKIIKNQKQVNHLQKNFHGCVKLTYQNFHDIVSLNLTKQLWHCGDSTLVISEDYYIAETI